MGLEKHKTLKEILAFILLQTVLIIHPVWAGPGVVDFRVHRVNISALSPGLNLNSDNLKEIFFLARQQSVSPQGVLPFKEIDKAELLTRNYSKRGFYSVSNPDFIQGFDSGYWRVNHPLKDIFQSCACIVFIDKKGNISLAHLNLDLQRRADLKKIVSEWAEYACTDERGNFISALDEENLFSAQTKAIIVSRTPDTVLAKQIRDFLSEKGLEQENIYLDPAPTTVKNDTAGIFIHPAKQTLQITYARRSEKEKKYQITQVHEYSLKDIFTGALKLNSQKNIVREEVQKKVITADDLKEVLNKLDFKYANKFTSDFKLPLLNEYGNLQFLLVTGDGEYAFALRETLHYGLGKGVTFRMINLMEINPFLGNFGKEEKNGYCQFAIDVKQKKASLSLNNDTIIMTNYPRNNGLASAMLSLAISLAEEAGMKKITVYNVIDSRVKSLYMKLGFVPVSSRTMAIDLEHKPEPNPDGTGSWLMKDVAKHRKFRFVDFRAETEKELFDNSENDIIKRLLNNDLINVFVRFEKNKTFGKPFYPIIKQILHREDEIIKEVIKEVEGMGEARIEAEGREILEDFNSLPVNAEAKKVHSWAEFVELPTRGEYDLTQMFAHSISVAQGWLQLLGSDEYDKFVDKIKKEFKRNFRKGYIVLRSIEIESRKYAAEAKTHEFLVDKTLPDVMLKKIDERQANLQADLLAVELETRHISILDNAMDVNSRYVYSAVCANNTEIMLFGREMWYGYKDHFSLPDTYYVSIIQNGKIIGYGVLEANLPVEDAVQIAFRIFKEYRHQKDLSKKIFKTLMASGREVFGSDIKKFMLMFHQINEPEGIDTAAVLFYLKMGFEILDEQSRDFWLNVCKPKLEKGQELSRVEIEKLSSTNLLFSVDKAIENSAEADLKQAPLFKNYPQTAVFIGQSI